MKDRNVPAERKIEPVDFGHPSLKLKERAFMG